MRTHPRPRGGLRCVVFCGMSERHVGVYRFFGEPARRSRPGSTFRAAGSGWRVAFWTAPVSAWPRWTGAGAGPVAGACRRRRMRDTTTMIAPTIRGRASSKSSRNGKSMARLSGELSDRPYAVCTARPKRRAGCAPSPRSRGTCGSSRPTEAPPASTGRQTALVQPRLATTGPTGSSWPGGPCGHRTRRDQGHQRLSTTGFDGHSELPWLVHLARHETAAAC